MKSRCINLDWLEVHAVEVGEPKNADWFISKGVPVNVREYGTRVFAEMFTILDENGHPLLEVRRNPKTPLLTPYDVHLRLHNRACYYDNAAGRLKDFMNKYGYNFERIVRADICLDFEYFDSGDLPVRFLRRYMNGTYSKINQANVHSHGTDTWSERCWNSISWGSLSSCIGTKFYNKTLELYDPSEGSFGKPHIRHAWLLAGLIDDWYTCTRKKEDGTIYRPDIWRVEFSIRAATKNWFAIELNGKKGQYQSIRNTLDMYDSREKLLLLFASLCQHYFHFKYYEEGKRKDRCEDKKLFDFGATTYIYKVGRDSVPSDKRSPRYLSNLISKIRHLRENASQKNIIEACTTLINFLQYKCEASELAQPWNREELIAMRTAFRLKLEGDNTDYTKLLQEIKKLMQLNDMTIFL